MADPAPRSHVIADRYLTSPAALAASPYGPVDALDTHSGRGAQVRIVFTGPEWDEAALAGAVARWCGIGCSEVCGVLDFGRHGDRWFLVLPPSLGLPVERWRMLRRPTAADAARLTLAFGRLAERVAAAGFSPDAASLADVAVGPGPTPFLERPLLQPHGARAPGPGDGQRVLAAVCAAALGSLETPADLGAWAENARVGGFAGLAECLDELERCGVAAPGSGAGAADAPPGLEHLFDDGFDLDGPAISPPREPRRPRVIGVSVVIAAIFAVLALLGHGAHQGQASTTPAVAPAVSSAVVPVQAPSAGPATGTAIRPPKTARRTRAGHVRRRRRHHAARRVSAPPPGRTVTAPPPAATTIHDRDERRRRRHAAPGARRHDAACAVSAPSTMRECAPHPHPSSSCTRTHRRPPCTRMRRTRGSRSGRPCAPRARSSPSWG